MDGIASGIAALRGELRPCMDALGKLKAVTLEADVLRGKACSKVSEKEKKLRRLRSELSRAAAAPASAAAAAELELDLQSLEGDISELSAAQPSTGSFFVRLFLGSVNTRVASPVDREKLRDEFDKFKFRTNIGFIIAPLIWAVTLGYLRHVWLYTDWIYTLTHLWLLYYYISLALRENILRANGSAIRPWWIYHHYLSATISVLMLTAPADGRVMANFQPLFIAYFLYQGVVQIAQARYQNRRHYALRAMGKAGVMDVRSSEGLTEFHWGLWFIVSLVVIAQAWQVFNGITLLRVLLVSDTFSVDASALAAACPSAYALRAACGGGSGGGAVTADHGLLGAGAAAAGAAAGGGGGGGGALWTPWYMYREELQCAGIGAIFILVGLCNFINTVQTLLDKGQRDKIKRAQAQPPPIPLPRARSEPGGAASPTRSGGCGSDAPAAASPAAAATAAASASAASAQGAEAGAAPAPTVATLGRAAANAAAAAAAPLRSAATTSAAPAISSGEGSPTLRAAAEDAARSPPPLDCPTSHDDLENAADSGNAASAGKARH